MALPIASCGARQDFQFGDLPIATVNLSAAGSTPGTGGSSITAWQWVLVGSPDGSAAALASATTETPTLDDLDLPGDYVVFARVTDNLGAVSIALGGQLVDDVWTMPPTSAFAVIEVRSEHADLAIPGQWERNTAPLQQAWNLETDANTGRLDTLVVQDLTDVAGAPDSGDCTGPNLVFLTNGSYATDDGLTAGVALHVHGLDVVDPATTAGLGAVQLGANPVDAGHPLAENRARVALCAGVQGKVAPSPVAGNPSRSICAVGPIQEDDWWLVGISIRFDDGGATTRVDYDLATHIVTDANFAINTYGAALGTLNIPAPGTANAPITDTLRFTPTSVPQDSLVAWKLTGDADVADQASNLLIQALFERRI